jgi:hypothetical protein
MIAKLSYVKKETWKTVNNERKQLQTCHLKGKAAKLL